MTTPTIQTSGNGLSLLTQLLRQGDIVAIIQGRLSVTPSNGVALPQCWFNEHESILTQTIIKQLGINAYRYVSYSTGAYGKQNYQGITLQFEHLLTGELAYVVFNASLKRAKTTKHGKKGEPLLGKKFITTKGSKFCQFWQSTGLKVPNRLSEFYCYMGNLKPLIFIGNVDNSNRFIDKKITLIGVHYQLILTKNSGLGVGEKMPNITDKVPTSYRHRTDIVPTSLTDIDFELDQAPQALQSFSTTGEFYYGNKVIRKQGNKEALALINTTNKQVISANDNRAKIAKKSPQEQTVDEWLDDWEKAPSLPNASGKTDAQLDAEIAELMLAAEQRQKRGRYYGH